jgi:hypothetical protein
VIVPSREHNLACMSLDTTTTTIIIIIVGGNTNRRPDSGTLANSLQTETRPASSHCNHCHKNSPRRPPSLSFCLVRFGTQDSSTFFFGWERGDFKKDDTMRLEDENQLILLDAAIHSDHFNDSRYFL